MPSQWEVINFLHKKNLNGILSRSMDEEEDTIMWDTDDSPVADIILRVLSSMKIEHTYSIPAVDIEEE